MGQGIILRFNRKIEEKFKKKVIKKINLTKFSVIKEKFFD